jgi:hypothetical protein
MKTREEFNNYIESEGINPDYFLDSIQYRMCEITYNKATDTTSIYQNAPEESTIIYILPYTNYTDDNTKEWDDINPESIREDFTSNHYPKVLEALYDVWSISDTSTEFEAVHGKNEELEVELDVPEEKVKSKPWYKKIF